MDSSGLYSRLLADSDIWSELLSTLFILLFIAVPAIIRTITEAQNRQKERQRLGQQKIEDVSKHKIGPQGLGPADNGAKRPRGPLSEWDRRQQQIRERMNRFKEQADSRIRTYQQTRPQPAPKPQARPVHEEVLPVAQALPEQPRQPVRTPRPPAYRPTKPAASTGLPEKIRRYMQTTPPVTVNQQPVQPHKPRSLTKTKLVSPGKKSHERLNPAIERIVRSSNPLRAGIILKEIFDKPKSLRFESDL